MLECKCQAEAWRTTSPHVNSSAHINSSMIALVTVQLARGLDHDLEILTASLDDESTVLHDADGIPMEDHPA